MDCYRCWVYTIILDHWGQCSSLQLDCGLWGSLKRDTADLKWDTKMAPLTAHFGHTGIDLNSLEILQYTTVLTIVTTGSMKMLSEVMVKLDFFASVFFYCRKHEDVIRCICICICICIS